MEKGSMEEFVVRKQSLMYGVAFKILRNRADTEDAVAAATEKLLKKAHLQFEGRGKLSNYAHQTVKNECFLLIRTNGRRRKWDGICHATFVGTDRVAPVERSEVNNARRTLLPAIEAMKSPLMRTTAMTLLHTDSAREAAKALGITRRVLYTRTSQVRATLSKALVPKS